MAKILVSFDPDLLEQVDCEARRRGITRSALLSEFVLKGLGPMHGPGADPEVQRALAETDALFHGESGEESTLAIRAERNARAWR